MYFPKLFRVCSVSLSQGFRRCDSRIASIFEKRYCSSENNSHIVQMRGLEPETKESEIIDYFKPLGVIPKEVRLKFDASGRVAGVSEVEFATHADAVVAMRKRNAFMGSRFIRLTLKSSGGEGKTESLVDVLTPSQEKNGAQLRINEVVPSQAFNSSNSLLMKNAPKRLTDLAIFEFFWPVGSSPISVKPAYNESGLRTGEYEVQFLTKKDAARAMSKNNAYLGNKFVELSLMK